MPFRARSARRGRRPEDPSCRTPHCDFESRRWRRSVSAARAARGAGNLPSPSLQEAWFRLSNVAPDRLGLCFREQRRVATEQPVLAMLQVAPCSPQALTAEACVGVRSRGSQLDDPSLQRSKLRRSEAVWTALLSSGVRRGGIARRRTLQALIVVPFQNFLVKGLPRP